MLLNEVQKLHGDLQREQLEAKKHGQHAQQQDETIRLLQDQSRELTTRLAALEALLSSKVPTTATSGQ